LDLTGLPGGTQLDEDLIEAFKYSAQADQDLAGWATAAQSGCTRNDTSSLYYAAQEVASNNAETFKQRAAAIWDPIGRRYHLFLMTDNHPSDPRAGAWNY